MQTPAPTSELRPSLFRRLFSGRAIRKIVFVIAALVTLGALFFAEEHWRGARAWANYKSAMEAKGDHFDIARLIPPKVPDAQNFGMTPLFAPLFTSPPGSLDLPLRSVTHADGSTYYVGANRGTNIALPMFDLEIKKPARPSGWNYAMASDLVAWAKAIQKADSTSPAVEISDPAEAAALVLDELKTSESTLAELATDAARPSCRFNITYEDWGKPEVMNVLMEHFALIKWLFRDLSLHAQAELAAGHSDRALQDLDIMFRIDDGMKDEPLVLSQLVRFACIHIILQPLAAGLAERHWSDAQLQQLQDRLRKTDTLASMALAYQGERDICVNLKFDQGIMSPKGWNRLEQVNLNRAFQEIMLPRINPMAHVIDPSVNHSLDLEFRKEYMGSGIGTFLHHDIMARVTLPALFHTGEKTASAQSEVDMAEVACALERYRLAQGDYPDGLDALVPQFISSLPHDVVNGQALQYLHQQVVGRPYILCSAGWQSSSAAPQVESKTPSLRGDWIWKYPVTD